MEGLMSQHRPVEDHKRVVRERWNRYMRGDFDPWNLPPHTPRADDRMLAAMEYCAYQLGEINQQLAYLVNLTQELRDGRG
jgi:hypothetical protein